jgi:hypothetical protein
MLTGDRIGGASNARRVLARWARTLTPAWRFNGNACNAASPAWRRPAALPLGRPDQTFAVAWPALLVRRPACADDPNGAARQMAGRAASKNEQEYRVHDEAGGPASWSRFCAPWADRGRSVTVRSAPAWLALESRRDASRRANAAMSRCALMPPGPGMANAQSLRPTDAAV